MRRGAGKAAAVVLALLATLPAMGGCSPGLTRGIFELEADDPSSQATVMERTKSARAQIARILIRWYLAAPDQPPSSTEARDPNWSGYRWDQYDAQIRAATDAGLDPLVVVTAAPAWAEGSDKPANAPVTAWKPSPSAFHDFAIALAQRYNGTIQPRVRFWQPWNEPNVNTDLAPQWDTQDGQTVPTGPSLYKGLLNAFYDGVKEVDPTNIVVTGGTAPFGFPNVVMSPAYFWRRVLCVKDGSPPQPEDSCPVVARFDALAHHPYPQGPPSQPASNPDDVVIADMTKLTGPLKVATDAGYVYPQLPKQVWVTELGYDSNPPDPKAVPIYQHAAYLEGAMYLLYKQGVSEFTWFELRDQPEGRYGWSWSSQTGLYFRGSDIQSDFPKPALAAFRFPFTAYRTSGSAVELWGIAPRPDQAVVIERQVGSNWQTVATVTPNDSNVFDQSLDIGNGAVLRARQGSENSLNWTTAASGP